MLEMNHWLTDAIRHEKINDKVFYTKEKGEIASHINGISKRHIFSLSKDTIEDAFSNRGKASIQLDDVKQRALQSHQEHVIERCSLKTAVPLIFEEVHF